MSEITYLTQEGYDKLKKEIETLKSVDRLEVSKAIAEAREKGDLSENAEYHAAKDAQGLLEAKINNLEQMFAVARVIDPSQLDSSRVTVLSKVTIKNKKTGKELMYQLVGQSEADLKAKKISVKSPIGEGLLGKQVGEIAKIETPAGILEFEVMNISLG